MLGRLSTYDRLRIGTDGKGVTTLVAFYGCPLKCKYCINNDLYNHDYVEYSVKDLYDKVVIDDLYFTYTEGGICFGGHEPLLQSDYIKEFVEFVRSKNKVWKFTLETSLNISLETVKSLVDYIDTWIIDVKDMDDTIYLAYTKKSNKQVKKNLLWLSENVDVNNVILRLPLIHNFNSKKNIQKSKKELKCLGFKDSNFDVFSYVGKWKD